MVYFFFFYKFSEESENIELNGKQEVKRDENWKVGLKNLAMIDWCRCVNAEE